MKRKLLLVLAVIFALAVTLTACEHIHTYAEEWTYDAEYHWREATCGDTEEVFGKEKHSMAGVPGGDMEKCTVCKYSKPVSVVPNPDVEPKPEHDYVDGVCTDCGQWSSVTDVVLAQVSKLDVWNYVITAKNVTANIPTSGNGAETVTVEYAELKLGLSKNGAVEGCGYINFKTSSNVNVVAAAAVKDGIVYARYEENFAIKYFRLTVEELLGELDIEIGINELKQFIEEINANTQQIQSGVKELLDALKQLPPQDGAVQWIKDTFLTLNTDKSTADTTVYTVKFDFLRTVNNVLNTKTVLQYFESVFGEGSYAKIPATAEALFDVKVGDILDGLEAQGYTLDDIIDMLNVAVAAYYPDDNVNTVDQLMAKLGVDLKGVTVKEYILLAKPLTPRQMLKLAQADVAADKQITVEQIIAALTDVCNGVKDLTVYDIIAKSVNLQINGGQLYNVVEGIAEILDGGLTVELSFKNNVLQQVYVEFDVDEPSLLDLNADEAEKLIYAIQQQLAQFKAGGVCIVNGGNLQQDYSKLIDVVISGLENV